MSIALPPIEANQPCFKCHRVGPLVVDRFAQQAELWEHPERFMHKYGLCPEAPAATDLDAATLPEQSVVATSTTAFTKVNGELADPWAQTGTEVRLTDAVITDLIQSGDATVLRVGDGAS